MLPTQPSQLLASLFQHIDEEQRLTVLDVGPALQDTVNFFAGYRGRLHIADLFSELPFSTSDPDGPSLDERFDDLMRFPQDTRFDICLFWDIFNYLDTAACKVFLDRLRPCLHAGTLAHGFAVHNLRSPQGDQQYGIAQADALSVRKRPRPLPGYAPHGQGQLKELLHCFSIQRTVLLPDSRLELLLQTQL